MKKRIFAALQYIVFLGGGLFLVWWQLRDMTDAQRQQFYGALRQANYWLVIPVVLMSLLSHLSRSMRWKLLMEPLGYRPALKNVFASTMVGYLANSAVPRLGEILKCTLLARYEKLKMEKLVGTILVERTFDFICYLIFIGITILIQINVIGSYAREKLAAATTSTGMPIWGKLLLLIVVIAFVVLGIRLLLKKYPDSKMVQKINSIFRGLAEGFAAIRALKKRRQFIYHTLFIWTMYLLQIYIGFNAIDGTAHLSIKAACAVLTLATLAMIATPGGIGVFPILVMQTLKVYSVEEPLGEAFGWLIWGISTSIIIIAGFISLLVLPYINRKKHETGERHTGENLYD